MRYNKLMLAVAMLAFSSAAFTSCDEDLEVPPLSIPTTDVKANITILEFKEKYWQNDNNYCTQIGKNDAGEDIILGGRIIASDEGGNIYQNLMLQDETGAITIATYTSSTAGLSNLYSRYKVGEEMYINVTDLYAGKYAGLFQVGAEGSYNGTPQTSKMEAATFLSHTFLNGLPKPGELDVFTMTIPEIEAQKSNAAGLQKWQSQLVRINDVSWIGGGTETWATQGSSGDNRYLIDAAGNRMLVRNSGHSDFNQQILPSGHGDVVGILSYYNGSWQFLFRSPDDCMDFGGESYAPQIEGEGTAESPYTVGAVLAGASGSEQWVTGYIVGWVEGQALSSGAHFSVPASSASNLLLAANANETNVGNCIPVQLTNGTSVRTDLNLQANPANLGKQVSIKGNLETYFGSAGIKSPTAYAWGDKGDDSGAVVNPPVAGDVVTSLNVDFEGLSAITGLGNWTTVDQSGNATWFTQTYNNNTFAACTGYGSSKTPGTDGFVSWLITPGLNVSGMSSKTFSFKSMVGYTGNGTLEVFAMTSADPATATLTKLNANIPAPDGSWSDWVESGEISLSGFSGVIYIGFRYQAAQASGYTTYRIDDVIAGDSSSSGGETPVTGTQFKKVTSITSGKVYLMVAEGKAAIPNTANYGYLKVTDVTDNGGVIVADEANGFTFTATTGGYNIVDSNGKYLYQTGSFNSFNFATSASDESVWSVTANGDGTFKITNTSVNKSIQYDSQYTSYGSYSDTRGTYPALYEKVN